MCSTLNIKKCESNFSLLLVLRVDMQDIVMNAWLFSGISVAQACVWGQKSSLKA